MEEFKLINKIFYKLSKHPENLGLIDDTALITNLANTKSLITTDTIVQGMHFFNLDNPKSIANRLLYSNISDIAAMGGLPKYWLLNISIPKNNSKINIKWFNAFAKEIKRIQNLTNCHLIGGDTTSTNHAMVLSATVIGNTCNNLPPLLKTTAKAGDYICVTGNLGNAYLGFNVLNKTINNIPPDINLQGVSQYKLKQLSKLYYYISAETQYANLLSQYASSCADISDGLIADLHKVCLFSNVCGVINLQDIPLSKDAKKFFNTTQLLINALTWGDDYKLVFTVSKQHYNTLIAQAQQQNLNIYTIGYIKNASKQKGLQIYNNGKLLRINKKGNVHQF